MENNNPYGVLFGPSAFAGRRYLSPEELARLRRAGYATEDAVRMSAGSSYDPGLAAGGGRGFVNPARVDPTAPAPTVSTAGAGRGVVNPAPVNPELPPPVFVPNLPVPQGPMDGNAAPAAAPASPLATAMGDTAALAPGILNQPPVDPRAALYDGMIQAGAGILANTDNPAKAFSAGLTGFNKGYDDRVASEKAKQAVKVTPLANGAAALVQYGDGRVEVKPIKEVQDFMLAKERLDQQPQMQKLADEKAQKARALTQNYRGIIDSTNGLTRALTEAKGQIGTFSAGPIGQATSWIGGTPAAALESTLKTIKANLGFNQLQQMRDSSPTGGALGQVAVQELEFLQSVEANLDQKNGPTELAKNIQEVQNRLASRTQRLRQAYQEDVRRGLIPAGAIPELEGVGAAPASPGAGSSLVPQQFQQYMR